MHKFAFGQLGLTPYQYYTMSPYEFICTCEGFFDKMDSQAKVIRNLASIVMGVAGSKERIEKVWPMWGDMNKNIDELVMDKEMYEAIKKAHGIN